MAFFVVRGCAHPPRTRPSHRLPVHQLAPRSGSSGNKNRGGDEAVGVEGEEGGDDGLGGVGELEVIVSVAFST
jgi:hypothetical protein